MSVTKRIAALLVAALTALLALAGFGTSAQAAPYHPGTVNITVSTTNPGVGADVTISVSGFRGHIVVDVTLHTATYNLGTAETDAAGDLTDTVKLPDGVSGHHTIEVTDPVTHRTASIEICIGTCQGAGNGRGSGSGNGGLSATGVAVAGIGALGVVLLAGGALLLLAGRRRNAAVR